jgi:hypothetical protein
MARHWRTPYQPKSRLNLVAVWTIGACVVLATLVVIARHGYI